MKFLQGADAVADDIPAEHFFVDVAELDPAGEFSEISIFLDERLGVENNRVVEITERDVIEQGAPQFCFDLIRGEAELETDGGKLDTLFEVEAIPQERGAVSASDHDHRILLSRRGLGGSLGHGLSETVGRARRPIENVVFRDFVMARLHQLFLDHVLNFFDMEKGLFDLEGTLRDRAGNGGRGRGILLQREKGFTDGDLDFAFVPRHHLMVAADEADGDTMRFAGNIELGSALKQEALGDVVGVIVD